MNVYTHIHIHIHIISCMKGMHTYSYHHMHTHDFNQEQSENTSQQLKAQFNFLKENLTVETAKASTLAAENVITCGYATRM